MHDEQQTRQRAESADGSPQEAEWTEVDLWAEIHRLRAAVKGPDGYASWQDAAVAERVRRVRAEKPLTRDEAREIAFRAAKAHHPEYFTGDDFEPHAWVIEACVMASSPEHRSALKAKSGVVKGQGEQ